MIFGVGTDITEVNRFQKWVDTPSLLHRFFSEEEINTAPENRILEYYASRFACKEAFAKALGTGFSSFSLKEISIENDKQGKPFIKTEGNAENLVKKLCGDCIIHVSLSHEKEYAVAFVVIEKL